MTRPPSSQAWDEVRIGLIGADQADNRMIAIARDAGLTSWRLVPAVCADEGQAHQRAAKIASQVDVCLFSGPLPYHTAASEGELPVPATYVRVDGSALHGTLLRGILAGILDPLRLSIDSVTDTDVADAYREIGSDPAAVRILPYTPTASAADFRTFHLDLFERGQTSAAVTTVPSVRAALAEASVPALIMPPSTTTIRHACTPPR